MKRGVAFLLSERDVDEIFITYSIEALLAKAEGLQKEEILRRLPRRVLDRLIENSERE